jgi:hypothetical protein
MIRPTRITWRPHVAIWRLVWTHRELLAKGAQVDGIEGREWRVVW